MGGGASRLVDGLLDLGVEEIAVLDISEAGLDVARPVWHRASSVRWIAGDVTELGDIGRFDVWHDRAVFHFLTSPDDRQAYVDLAERTLSPAGPRSWPPSLRTRPGSAAASTCVVTTPRSLPVECGPGFALIDSTDHVHTTPRGVQQHFQYSMFRRVAPVLSGASA